VSVFCNKIMSFSVLTQKMSVLAPGAPALRARLPARPAVQRANPTFCSAAKRPELEPASLASKLAVPFAGALAAAMLLGAVLPEDALAARQAQRVLLGSTCYAARA